jgi:TetR/AcrR family fatty acid metabolism transcriptional regulator
MAEGYLEKYQRGKHETRREHILDAAFTIFLEGGFKRTKMEEIARAAGYGKSTLYEYFDSKDAILSELLEAKFVGRYYGIAAAADDAGTPEDRIRSFLGGEMDLILEYGANDKLVQLLMTRPEEMASPLLMKTGHKIVLFKFERISGYIREGIADGSFREMDVFIAGSLVIGACSSYLATVTSPEYKKHARKSGKTDADRRAAFFDLIFRALKK